MLAIANISIDATTNDDTIIRATSVVYISFSVLNFLLMRYIILSFYPINHEIHTLTIPHAILPSATQGITVVRTEVSTIIRIIYIIGIELLINW